MTNTRSLVLDSLPTVSITSYYQYVITSSVLDVVITPRCLTEANNHTRRLPDIHTSLATLALRHLTTTTTPLLTITTTPLHVTVRVKAESAYQQLRQLVNIQSVINNSFTIPITYEIFDMPIRSDLHQALAIAFAMRAVVHFADHHSPMGPDDLAYAISNSLLDCFKIVNQSVPVTPGQLHLCDIPVIVLSPEELATSSDPKEVALRKLFDNLDFCPLPGHSPGPQYLKPTRGTFKARVKLVESGFRPGMSD
jgi:hypothetical protein